MKNYHNRGLGVFKTMGKTERATLVALAIVSFCALFLIVSDIANYSSKVPDGSIQIGTLERYGEDVKRKFSGEFEFQKTDKNETLYQKDTIFVGPGSKAKFDLPDYGGEVLVEPNSIVLIVLDFDKKEEDLKFQPRLRLKLEQGKMTFKKKEQGNEKKSNISQDLVVEIADNTLVDLKKQNTITFEKEEAGDFKVSEATEPVVAYVYSSASKTQSVPLKLDTAFSSQSILTKNTIVEAKPLPATSHQVPLKLNPPGLEKIHELLAFKVPTAIKTKKESRQIASADPPSSAVNEKMAAKNSSGPNVAVSPYYLISALDSKDQSTGNPAKLATQYNVGLNVSHITKWSESFYSMFSLKLGLVSLEKPTNSAKSVQDANKFISGVGFETSHALSANLNLKLKADYQKELFVRGITTNSVTVDAIAIPSISIKSSFDMAHFESSTAGVAAQVKYLFPTDTDNYKVLAGTEYTATMYVRQASSIFDESKYQAELSYVQRGQNTSLTVQTESSVFLGVRFFYPAGRN